MIRYCELCEKQVINIADCCCLGNVVDLELDECNGRICALVVAAPGKFFLYFLSGMRIYYSMETCCADWTGYYSGRCLCRRCEKLVDIRIRESYTKNSTTNICKKLISAVLYERLVMEKRYYLRKIHKACFA